MLKCSAFSAVWIAVVAACASSQPAPPPAAAEPAPADLPPAPIEATSSSSEQAADAGGDVKPDSSLVRDAGTGISDMDASPDGGAGTAAACKTDADCVPAQCCHATSCVAKGAAPNCATTMCTKECRGGTMDCGGGCFCQQGKCNAKLGRP